MREESLDRGESDASPRMGAGPRAGVHACFALILCMLRPLSPIIHNRPPLPRPAPPNLPDHLPKQNNASLKLKDFNNSPGERAVWRAGMVEFGREMVADESLLMEKKVQSLGRSALQGAECCGPCVQEWTNEWERRVGFWLPLSRSQGSLWSV